MTMRSIRARVHSGRIEPLEAVTLPEGCEVTLVVNLPEAVPAAKARTLRGRFPELGRLSDADLEASQATWSVGALKQLGILQREPK